MTAATFNNAAGITRQCKVRFSTSADTPALIAYYNENPHQHVEQLDEGEITAGAAAGRYMMLLNDDGSIAASSGAYDYHDGSNHEAGWIEIGSTRARLEGFNLYPFMIASQVVHEFLSQPPKDFFFATIYSDNTAVSNFLEKKVGWRPFTPDEDLLNISGERDNHEQGRIVWLTAESHSLPHQARVALDFMDRASTIGLENRKTGERLKLDIASFELGGKLRPAVEALAHGTFGKALENNTHIPLRRARELLQEFLQNRVFIFRPEGLSL